jgi:hypothetical protein
LSHTLYRKFTSGQNGLFRPQSLPALCDQVSPRVIA